MSFGGTSTVLAKVLHAFTSFWGTLTMLAEYLPAFFEPLRNTNCTYQTSTSFTSLCGVLTALLEPLPALGSLFGMLSALAECLSS